MSTNDPFLPVTQVRPDEIDAADPRLGAPGTPTPSTVDGETDEAEREFEDRMEQARAGEQIFRTPTPPHDQPASDPATD